MESCYPSVQHCKQQTMAQVTAFKTRIKKYVELLEWVQRSAMKITGELEYYCYEDRLRVGVFHPEGGKTFKYIWWQHQAQHQALPAGWGSLKLPQVGRVVGADIPYLVAVIRYNGMEQSCWLPPRKKSFPERVVSHWNLLPGEVVIMSTSMAEFKGCDRYPVYFFM